MECKRAHDRPWVLFTSSRHISRRAAVARRVGSRLGSLFLSRAAKEVNRGTAPVGSETTAGAAIETRSASLSTNPTNDGARAGSRTLNLGIKRLRAWSVSECQGVSQSVCVKVSIKVSKRAADRSTVRIPFRPHVLSGMFGRGIDVSQSMGDERRRVS